MSTVARIWTSLKDGEPPQWVVSKSAPVVRRFSREPHDIVKELRLLNTLSHSNVSILDSMPCLLKSVYLMVLDGITDHHDSRELHRQ